MHKALDWMSYSAQQTFERTAKKYDKILIKELKKNQYYCKDINQKSPWELVLASVS